VDATIKNMRNMAGLGLIAYSPSTGEEYSADAGDYFWADDNFTLTDQLGNAMLLGSMHAMFEEAGE
jgi:hypothetical protein